MLVNTLITAVRARVSDAPSAVVALSGGVDSGLVAYLAHQALGGRALAVTVRSELTPVRDVDGAVAVARHIGIEHEVVNIAVLQEQSVAENNIERCYHCKKLIFSALLKRGAVKSVLMDGTNHDDDPQRPGLKAAKELDVYSPLKELGVGKADVRGLAKSVGLPNWDAVSESCLATRIPHEFSLTQKGLDRVQAMESFFHDLGVDTLRARHDNLMATVEYLPQYANIMKDNRDQFMALVQKIGLRSCEFKEWLP